MVVVDKQHMPENTPPEPGAAASDNSENQSIEAHLGFEFAQAEAENLRYRQQITLDMAHLQSRLEAEQRARQHLEQLVEETNALEQTLAYKLVQRWWRTKEHLIPTGTQRSRIYLTLRTGTILLMRRGPAAFGRAALLYVQGRRGYWQQIEGEARFSTRLRRSYQTLEPGNQRQSRQQIELAVHIDAVQPDSHVPQRIHVRGWAVDKALHNVAHSGVDVVRFYLGDTAQGRLLGEVTPSLPRPELARTGSEHTGYPFAGFEIYLNDVPPGEQIISAVAYHLASSTVSTPYSAQITILGEPYAGNLSDLPVASELDYQSFITRTEPDVEAIARQFYESAQWVVRPTFDLITVLHERTPAQYLMLARSVTRQSYREWQWYLVLSEEAALPAELQALSKSDTRIHLLRLEQSTHQALVDAASRVGNGEFVIPLEADALLAPHALYTFACAVRDDDAIDLLYSDHDHLNTAGQRHDPLLKPDWSPQLLFSTPYAAYLAAFRRTLLAKLDYFSSQYEHLYLWDVLLRASLQTTHVTHVAKILYHRRASLHPQWNEREQAQIKTMLSAYVRSQGMNAPQVVFTPRHPIHAYYPLITWSLPNPPRISIVIPSRDTSTVAPLLNSLFHFTTYPNFEVILVYTGEQWETVQSFYAPYLKDSRFHLVHFDHSDKPFNFHEANHFGFEQASGEFIVFLNDDTEVLEGGWLAGMAQWFGLPGVAAVGPKLLFPNGTIQHAGVIYGMHGLAGHVFLSEREYTWGLWGTDGWYRNLSAVTGGCLMVSRAAFEAVGQFDADYILHFGDVDFGMRLIQAGYQVVYTPGVRLKHRESATTHREAATQTKRFYRNDWDLFAKRWLSTLRKGDPYYNVNLSILTSVPTLNTSLYPDPGVYLEARLSQLPTSETFTL